MHFPITKGATIRSKVNCITCTDQPNELSGNEPHTSASRIGRLSLGPHVSALEGSLAVSYSELDSSKSQLGVSFIYLGAYEKIDALKSRFGKKHFKVGLFIAYAVKR